MKKMSSFKKSVLSIVFMSAVTGSFISWDKYQPRHETQSLVEFYENRDLIDHFAFLETIDYANKTSSMKAEEKLLIESELIAQTLAENIYEREVSSTNDLLVNPEQLYSRDLNSQSINLKLLNSEYLPLDKSDSEQIYSEISEAILFAFDSSKVANDYFPLLNETAKRMQDENIETSKTWQVVGYADIAGNNIYNSQLASKRAQAVTEYLVNKGVNANKLMIVSLGESQSEGSEHSEENNRLARRVEIHDYDNLVATLSEQFNSQIKREIANQRNAELLQLKRQQIAYQQELQQLNETKALAELQQITKNQQITSEVENQFEFSQQQKENLTTVMKL
tara:strand:- start:805 stop:1815 length:1011 start_codon:yes stop_codon:yes gene_type:complete